MGVVEDIKCNDPPAQSVSARSLKTLDTACEPFGSPTWARTRDLRINSPALYRLSYRGIEPDRDDRSGF